VKVFDDYGHHPTEILATLSAARNSSSGRRIVIAFQPHRYSRTKDLMEDFARAFNNADCVRILDIYPASEAPIEGISAEVLTEKIREFGHKDVDFIGGVGTAAAKIVETLEDGDLLITLGAGSITNLSDEVLDVLKEKDG
jgi:UDP-N-acetylmuramate--alanine ligase